MMLKRHYLCDVCRGQGYGVKNMIWQKEGVLNLPAKREEYRLCYALCDEMNSGLSRRETLWDEWVKKWKRKGLKNAHENWIQH
jgi:hypothetical protein